MKKVAETEEIQNFAKSSDKLLVGGFGLSGTLLTILNEILKADIKDLTVVSNNLGDDGQGLHKLFMQGKIKKAVGSYFTTNKEAVNVHYKQEKGKRCD